MSARSVSEVFDANAARGGERLAVQEADAAWSWAELAARSRELSALLDTLGPQRGERVALMLPNSGGFVAAFFAIARAGAVVAPFSTRYRSQELVFYLEDSRATALVTDAEGVPHAREALAQMQRPPALIEMDREARGRLLAGRHPEARATATGDASALLQQYTSGSTGAPKRVVRSHANLLFELDVLARTFGLDESDRFLGVAPFSHVNGLVRTMMTSMFVGGTLYPVRAFRRREVLELLTRERITYFGAVPHMFVILAQTPRRGHVDLSSLRTVFSASAPLLPDDNRAFYTRYGAWVRQLYGSSETGTISVNLRSDVERCLESVGTPIEGVQVAILNDERLPLPPGEEGEIAIASPAAIRAYDRNPEASRAAFHDGVYLSGDLGRMDAEGGITLTGRKKFIINRGGFKVNPFEVEWAVLSCDKVREVVVLGAPGPHGDDIVRCVIVPEGECSEHDILRHCESRIADYKIPSRIEFRDALPKSDAGKILRNKL